jgi:hypothetical protein
MPITLKEAARRALAANRSMGNRKNTASAARVARAARAASLPSSLGSNAIEKRLAAIECSIKKIELQLKLVDGEIMGNKEFGELKKDILDCSELSFSNLDDIMDFLRSVDNKRADNRFKYILNVISIVCPLLSACNIGFLKNINTEEISSELVGDAINKTTSYLATLSGAINYFVENGDEGAGKIDTLMDLNIISSDAFDTYTGIAREGAEISVAKIGKMTQNVITLQKVLCKYLVIKSKKISKKLNWNILSNTFCLCVFYYILFSSVAGNGGGTSGNATNATGRFMEVGGSGGSGKKKKKRN